MLPRLLTVDEALGSGDVPLGLEAHALGAAAALRAVVGGARQWRPSPRVDPYAKR